MFGRRVDLVKSRVFVEVMVIEFVNHGVDRRFQLFEINAHTQVIEPGGPNRHLDLPVVAVRIFAVSGVGSEMMATGKVCFYKNIHSNSPMVRGMVAA